MFYLYILKSQKDNGFYIGITKDLEDRIKRHNQGRVKSTKPRRPWQLVYFEKYRSKSEALKRELHLKQMKSARYIRDLLNY